jgi:hypothetical protein
MRLGRGAPRRLVHTPRLARRGAAAPGGGQASAVPDEPERGILPAGHLGRGGELPRHLGVVGDRQYQLVLGAAQLPSARTAASTPARSSGLNASSTQKKRTGGLPARLAARRARDTLSARSTRVLSPPENDS